MAIRDFEFPGVTLTQVFEQVPSQGRATLGVACIGPQYVYRTMKEATFVVNDGATEPVEDKRVSGYVVESGWHELQATSLVVADGAQYDYKTYSGAFATSGGVATFTSDSVATAKITFEDAASVSGGTMGTGPIKDEMVLISGGSDTTFYKAFGTITGVEYPTSGATSGGAILYLGGMQYDANNAGATPTDAADLLLVHITSGAIAYDSDDITGATTLTASSVEIDPAELTIANSTFLGDGATGSATLLGGSVVVGVKDDSKYRVIGGDNSFISATGAFSDTDTVLEQLGPISADNPLSVATYCAVIEARGNAVYVQAAEAETAAAYKKAFSLLDKHDDIYSIVLATDMTGTEYRNVVEGMAAAVVKASEDIESKIRRTLWYGITVNATTAQDVISKKYTSTYRAQAVYADGVRVEGVSVGSYAAAAAAAGMRSYEAPHRPLANIPFISFKITGNTFPRSAQKEIAQEGIWIIDNNFNGVPVTLRQLTTAAKTNLNEDEESIVANGDEIALALCHVGEDMVGCSNIHPQLLAKLSDDITLKMDARLINTSGDVKIGPQLLSWTLVNLYQDPEQLDHVYATITCEPPKPFNRFHITLRII